MNYKHLAQEERYQIHELKRQNISLARIAAELQRDRSTISVTYGRWRPLRGKSDGIIFVYEKFQTDVITKCPC